jgi:TolB-like protein
VTVTVTSPDSGQIREQLERMLASPTFAGAGRHSRLLRFVVERTLAGRGDELKEYVLGTEVFDRADSYDPRIDSIVRVEARRLRNRLEEYYRTAGIADPVVIDVPRGNYVPTFSLRTLAPAIPSEPPARRAAPAVVVRTRTRSAGMLAAAATFLLAIVALVSWLIPFRTSPAQASAGPSMAVLRFQHYTTNSADALLAARLTDAVTTELARLRTLSVASRTSAAQFASETRSVSEIRSALNVDFVMEATTETTGDATVATVRVVDAARDRKVWVGEYTIGPGEASQVARRIAFEAAEGTLQYHARRTTSP